MSLNILNENFAEHFRDLTYWRTLVNDGKDFDSFPLDDVKSQIDSHHGTKRIRIVGEELTKQNKETLDLYKAKSSGKIEEDVNVDAEADDSD